jgi:cholesterol transport system auxiliary component
MSRSWWVGLRRLSVFLGVAMLASGCASLPRPADQPALHELGSGQVGIAKLPFALRGLKLRAPSWFASGAVQYRLAYAAPTERRSYVASRWAAAPAEMLQLRLARGLGVRAAPDGCVLDITLAEFVQDFSAPDASRATLELSAALVDKDGRAFAWRTLHVEEAAATPDAAGGIMAMRRASDRVAVEIGNWLAGLEGAASGMAGRCGS